MYEDDTPPAERRAQALSLDRDLLRELLGQEELRDLIDPGALEEVEAQLRGNPRNPDGLHDVLRRAATCDSDEYDPAWRRRSCASGARSRCASAGEERLSPVEDAGRYRDALGAMPPGGLPDAFLEPVEDALRSLLARFARARGPFTTAEAPSGSGRRDASSRSCGSSSARSSSSAASLRPGGHGARVVRRRGAAATATRIAGRTAPRGRARRAGDARPVPAELARHRPARDSARGARPAAGAAAPGRSGRATCSRAACPTTAAPARPAVRLRRAGLGRRRASTASRSSSARTRRCSAGRRCGGAAGRHGSRPRSATCSPAAPSSGSTSSTATGLEAEQALPALWDLVWAGEVTNDAWTPLRAAAATASRRPSAARAASRAAARAESTATQGRWSLTERLFAGPSRRSDRRALAELLLERQGIVTRDGVRAEGIPGGYGAVYGELKALETLGLCRRGYFVEGLGGAQFALGGAVERLRELRPRRRTRIDPLVLAAADPAQPYGAVLPWPKRAGGRASRVAGAQVVLLNGEAALFVERGGKTLVPLREPDEEWLRPALAALVAHVKRGRGKRLAVERFDGQPVTDTELMPLLVEAGFLAGPRRAVFRP